MTKLEKEIRAMTNTELLDDLLQCIQANAFKCANKGYNTNSEIRREEALYNEMKKRLTKEDKT